MDLVSNASHSLLKASYDICASGASSLKLLDAAVSRDRILYFGEVEIDIEYRRAEHSYSRRYEHAGVDIHLRKQ